MSIWPATDRRHDVGPRTATHPADTDALFGPVAADWASRYRERPSFRERLAVITAAAAAGLAGRTDARVLDFGGGPGVIAMACSGHAALVVNLDRSREMVRAGALHPQELVDLVDSCARPRPAVVRHVVGDLSALRPATPAFDLVLAISVLEYLEDPGATIQALARQLVPGGQMIFTVPAERSLVRRAERTLQPVLSRMPSAVPIPRVIDRGYVSWRPHGDHVPWRSHVAAAGLDVESSIGLRLADRGPATAFRPNILVTARRRPDPPSARTHADAVTTPAPVA